MKSIKIDLESLSGGAIETRSVDVDWSAASDDEDPSWCSYEAVACDKCGKVLVLHCGDGNCKHKSTDDDSECDGFVGFADGPMMNYWYPVRIDDCEDAARKIADLPLCVVEMADGATGLALTGGGMDLSWEICEAFIRIGYLPPARFSDLPGMAGKTLDAKTRAIVGACKKSHEVLIQRSRWAIERLAKLEKDLRAEGRKQKATMNACDHNHMTPGETRLLPIGGDGNVIVCRRHYWHEIVFRKERNRYLGEGAFLLPAWEDLVVYSEAQQL